MTNRFKNLFRAAAVLAAGMLAAVSAAAANPIIDEAKNQCLIGEQADGYLGVVAGESPSNAQRREMRDVNQQRKAVYTDLARRNGVSVEVTAQLTAEKLINQATPGQCVRNQQGRWIKIQ